MLCDGTANLQKLHELCDFADGILTMESLMRADERRARLVAAMADAGLDAVLIYGNAWQCDYLR